jgi:hypothetical protein
MTDGAVSAGLGYSSDGSTTAYSKLTNYIKTRNTKHKAVGFTYSFGDNADATLPKLIACELSGIWIKISNTDAVNLR